jgi:hypothetical protein
MKKFKFIYNYIGIHSGSFGALLKSASEPIYKARNIQTALNKFMSSEKVELKHIIEIKEVF